jgi:AraC-like DNA-binding protein
MDPIPLVRARYAHSFAVALDKLGAPTEKLLGAHRLSPELVRNQDGLITAHQLWSFAGEAARCEGLPELGLLAGQVPVVEHGDFGKMVYQAITLYDAIRTFCHNATIEYSRADFYLIQDEYAAWFCRGPIDGEPMQRQQVELYVLILMVDTIRLAAGAQWQPANLELQTTDCRGLADVPLFRNSNVRFSCPTTRIAVPRSLLSRRLLGNNIAAFTQAENAPADITRATDFGDSLRRVLKNYVGHEKLTLETTAEIVGTTPRTLQRNLRHAGLTYKILVDQLLFELALPLLMDKQQKLLDIALMLGYSDAAHFTRAFRRWAGMSPSDYRHYFAKQQS